MKKFKRIVLTLSILVLVAVLAGCALAPKVSKPTVNQTHYALGLRPMPKAFLNWWFDQIPKFNPDGTADVKNKKPVGLIGTADDIRSTQQLLTKPVLSNLPANFNLKDNGLVTSVKNQGANGTCWAFSTVGSIESAMLVQLGPSGIQSRYPFIPNPNAPDLSEQFVAYNNADWKVTPPYNPDSSPQYKLSYQETNEDIGGFQFFSFYDLVRRGDPLASDFPYITSKQPWIVWDAQTGTWPQHLIKPSRTIVIRPASKFSDYTTYINTVKSAIVKYGALAVSFTVYSDLDTFSLDEPAGSSGWVYPGPSSSARRESGHAVLLVGWDDDWTYNGQDYGPVWILKNSWGTRWGDQGYWRQPMLTLSEFNSKSIPDWKIANNYMWVPYFNK